MTQLILVGNGFDLAHGMKSSFGSFANSISPKTRNQWLLSLKKKNIEYGDGMWYDFEVLIEEITRKWFEDYFDIVVNNGDEKKVNEEVDEINESYNQITKTLIEYLLKEQEIKNYKKIESLSKEIKEDSYAINFNYTNILKKYVTNEKIHYIHGSLAENFIVLGYKYAPRHKGMPFEARFFEKEILREVLNYRRFIYNKGLESEVVKSRMKEFTPHLEMMFSGVGSMIFNYPEELENKIMADEYQDISRSTYGYFGEPYKDKSSQDLEERLKVERLKEILFELNEYGEKNDFKSYPINLNIDFDEVTEFLIIGHSFEADIELIEEIFNKITNVQTVKMFVYEGESKKSIEGKRNFINKFWKREFKLINY